MKSRAWFRSLAALGVVGFALSALTVRAEIQNLQAELKPDRVVIFIGTNLFTEYLFTADEKYPYFFPVMGPRTGQTVTIRRGKEFPHHSSIFFGCDRVNGGNYWQEGLERGRIVSKTVKLVRAKGPEVVFEQDCQWERPGAEPPFTDHRRITLSAPSGELRFLGFEVTLTARNKVRIEKSNHSLFSARVAPEISVKGGGRLVNAQGDESEKGTFGKPSPWADYCGVRNGQTEGVAVFVHPKNRWSPVPWFTRDYGFMSPTPMNWLEGGSLELAAGETIHLKYRVAIHAGNPDLKVVDGWYHEWAER